MGVSKVELSNGETLVDLTEDTVTAETLGEGATAHNSKGEEIVGTMKSGDMLKSVYDIDDDGKVDTANNSEKLGGKTLQDINDELEGSLAYTNESYLPLGWEVNGVVYPYTLKLKTKSGLRDITVGTHGYDAFYFEKALESRGSVVVSFMCTETKLGSRNPTNESRECFTLALTDYNTETHSTITVIDDARNTDLIAGNVYTVAIMKANLSTGYYGLIVNGIETDTKPTKDSYKFLTSGAVYDVIGDINSILDNINGEVV